MLYRRYRADRLAAAQALRRIRLRLCAHRAQGARLAMGRRGAIRRELRVPRQPRTLALYRRDARGEAAHRGGLIAVVFQRASGSAISAIAVNAAPARNVALGPATSHRAPATTLAASMATPLTRLNTPKAVPRNSAGAVSATSAASSPCVRPICRPHSATPIITVM